MRLRIPLGRVPFALVQRVVVIAATRGFLVAAAFLLVSLWGPARSASTGSDQGVQVSLLSLDRPEPPPARVNDLPLSTDEVEETEDSSPDLATELNTWIPTALQGRMVCTDHRAPMMFGRLGMFGFFPPFDPFHHHHHHHSPHH